MAKIRSVLSHPAAASLWADTATPADPTPALDQDLRADVLIVGAGYTGLSTALHLAQSGASVCVVDAHEPGWGASGRNGGQVNPTLKHDPDELVRLLGARAEPLIAAIAGAADVVFELIERHGIDCQPVRSGWLQASYTESAVPGLYRRAQQWANRGYPVELLDGDAMAKRTGTRQFVGGWLDGRAGSVQPLSYVRGLARAAVAAGVRLYGSSPVVDLRRNGSQWVAGIAGKHHITADQAVLATNGYSDGLWQGLARTILSANSFIVATRPLGEAAAHILPGGETLSTAQRLMVYLRKDAHGRVLLGGRGVFSDPGGPGDFTHIERALGRLYPELTPLDIEYRWGGRVAITPDFMPHVHRPVPGLTIALGYNGRGVAAATLMGRHIGALLAGGSEGDFPFPITSLSPIPLHGLQRFYISAGVAWYGLLDRLARQS